MKLRVGKKSEQPESSGRQRRQTEWRQPAAYSYHAVRAERPDSTTRQQVGSLADQRKRLLSLQFWLKRSGYVVVTVVLIACVISVLSLSTQPRIVLLDQGNTYAFRDTTTYQQAAAQQLSSSIWNRNKITVNTGAAATQLADTYAELASVRVVLPLIGHRPIYYLEASAPAYLMQSVNGSFVLDSRGKALMARDAAPEAIINDLPLLTDQTGISVKVGKQIISSTNADFIHTVITTLKQKNIQVESLILPAQNVQQLNVKVSGKPYIIKFDMHESGGARQQVGTYLATAATLEGQGKTPGQYIDVRVLGRVYYL